VTKFRFADFSNNNTVSPLIFVKRLPARHRVLMNEFISRTPTSSCFGIHSPDVSFSLCEKKAIQVGTIKRICS
jgi:hypothetical protein